ncbi:MAG: ATP-dependent DNA helicase [Gammaproteobacteria bacterium]|nr:ATP-dependent DNA helicase [Gammaproteobacteria bacterium]
MDDIDRLLGSQGQLVEFLPGFSPRPQQIQMANVVLQAIQHQQKVICEAGTGTGKTMAYLLPALISGAKTIISTGSRTLQDQLFFKDLPLVQKALGSPLKVALLKGRANYICEYRLYKHEQVGRFVSRYAVRDFHKIKQWLSETQSGDIAELTDIADHSEVWPLVTSTSDNCLGSDCDYFDTCAVNKARREALAADLVIVNHYLFFADLALKGEGVAELLPGAQSIILDEAHQLPDIASQFFSDTVSGRQFIELCRDTISETEADALESRDDVHRLCDAIINACNQLHRVLPAVPHRGPWFDIQNHADIVKQLQQLKQSIEQFIEAFEPIAAASSSLEQCLQRALSLQARLIKFTSKAENNIHWLETRKHNFLFNMTPLDIATLFRETTSSFPQAWIFTSATLSVSGEFDFFQQRLGLENATTYRWGSPFDYVKNTLLYTPQSMPEPNSEHYMDKLLEIAVPIIRAAQGRTFFLFTSHRALNLAAEALKQELAFPLLIQGKQSKRVLLNEFKTLGNAVLLGTASFWEGVDIQGEALSCVIIDKLPFASPGDPVLSARLQHLRTQKLDPFKSYQLPQAVISLQQGVGRLIRTEQDSGVLVICDPRLNTKAYGKQFLTSLPPMPKTSEIEDIKQFFQQRTATLEHSCH